MPASPHRRTRDQRQGPENGPRQEDWDAAGADFYCTHDLHGYINITNVPIPNPQNQMTCVVVDAQLLALNAMTVKPAR